MFKVVSSSLDLMFAQRVVTSLVSGDDSRYVSMKDTGAALEYVVINGDDPVSSVRYVKSSASSYEVSLVYTSPQFRRKGIASSLLSYSINRFFVRYPDCNLTIRDYSSGRMARVYSDLLKQFPFNSSGFGAAMPRMGISTGLYMLSSNRKFSGSD
jgi:GNAT superfamily N-acetyltransferase